MPYHLRFFFEYGVDTPLWPKPADGSALDSPYGYPCELNRLPISSRTQAELARLAEWYQASLNEEYPPGPTPWPQEERDLFEQQTVSALETLRRELGDGWVVEDHRH